MLEWVFKRISTNLFICILLAIMVTAGTSSEINTDGRDSKATESNAPWSLLTDMARELISRSGTSSQVLSLNLTNLIILLILKGLIFGTALIGSGSWKARSAEQTVYESILQQKDSLMINESEFLLFLSYLMGETTQNYECLKKVACSDTSKRSTQYLLASRTLMNGVKFLKDVIPMNKKYEDLVGEFQAAIVFGKNGGNCDERYICNSQNEV